MILEKKSAMGTSENSLPEDLERAEAIVGLEVDGVAQDEKSADGEPAIAASGDRALILMDLENDLVGWESNDDPMNPQ